MNGLCGCLGRGPARRVSGVIPIHLFTPAPPNLVPCSAEGSKYVEEASAGNCKRTWVNYGQKRDWFDQLQVCWRSKVAIRGAPCAPHAADALLLSVVRAPARSSSTTPWSARTSGCRWAPSLPTRAKPPRRRPFLPSRPCSSPFLRPSFPWVGRLNVGHSGRRRPLVAPCTHPASNPNTITSSAAP